MDEVELTRGRRLDEAEAMALESGLLSGESEGWGGWERALDGIPTRARVALDPEPLAGNDFAWRSCGRGDQKECLSHMTRRGSKIPACPSTKINDERLRHAHGAIGRSSEDPSVLALLVKYSSTPLKYTT